ncbi:hypothetical protein BJY04DRAFT_131382 [Aspergillus karnatakaensis]|uniref:uncharacterized protein n=1 Tax=Aspergillus karnatakaensis TaxID=1810916 RepID=UPI003CCD04F5
MDPDEIPPPPYSAVDPLLAPNSRNAPSSSNANLRTPHLRGGDARLHGPASASIAGPIVLPAHFSSAAAYFAERPPPTVSGGEQILEHQMTIYPRSQAKDFPRRPRCWSPRLEHVAQQDWDMFLRHLFPPHLGLASSSAELSRQVRAEIRRDRKDRPQETDEERERRIAAVMKEWNQYFFELRAVRVVFYYVTDPRSAPVSPLCPRCYPAATRSQENRGAQSQTPEAGRGHALQPPNPAGYAQAPIYSGQFPAPYGYTTSGQFPYPPQQGSGFYHPSNPHAYQYPYQQYQQYNWGNQYPQQYDNSSLKGGPLGWFSNLAAQAQKYGERITEQAERYGDQISAHASHYGRQVEEQAMAHGRWIEEQAGLGGRKVETAFSGWNQPQQQYNYPYYYPQPNIATAATTPNTTATATATPPPNQNTPTPPTTALTTTTPQSPSHQPQTQQPQQLSSRTLPLSRRNSTSSTTSSSSLSSISSISTTSDLSSTDLATVRTQLLSLTTTHDRDLYNAAVSLRRQLDALRESKRQARLRPGTTSSTTRWRNAWSSHSHSNSSRNSDSGQGRSSWGRWESPQDRARNQAERRAAKEELRATRKAFRDVVKRAREELKEGKRARSRRKREERRARRGGAEGQSQLGSVGGSTGTGTGTSTTTVAASTAPTETSLEQRLQNLELANPGTARSTRSDDVDSGSSAVSSISTPSDSSEEGKKAANKEIVDKEIK